MDSSSQRFTLFLDCLLYTSNHLDLPSKEVLEEALQEYEGTLLMVSHDRYMLNKIPDFIMEFTGIGVETYKGGYDDYFAEKDRRRAKAAVQQQVQASVSAKAVSSGGYRTRQQKNEEVKRRQRLKDLETRIAEKESQIQQLEQEITLPEIYENYILMGEKCKELEEKILSLFLQFLSLIHILNAPGCSCPDKRKGTHFPSRRETFR